MTKKRILSMLMAFAMLLSLLPASIFTVSADDAEFEGEEFIVSGTVGLGETTIALPDGGMVYYAFTPAEDGLYWFTSVGNDDTWAVLLDRELMEIVSDDDGGDDYNFKIVENLLGGEIYYIGVRFFSENAGEITLVVNKHTHIYENGRCTECGAGDPNHEHVFDYWTCVHEWDDETGEYIDEGHQRICAICSERYGGIMAHNYEDGRCIRCDAVDPNHEHVFSGWVCVNQWNEETGEETDLGHAAACARCYKAYGDIMEHNYQDGRCIQCGAVDPNHEHVYGEWRENTEENGHGRVCRICGDYIGGIEAHSFEHGRCTVCGAAAADHVHAYCYFIDASSDYRVCAICHEGMPGVSHNFDGNGICTECGWAQNTSEATAISIRNGENKELIITPTFSDGTTCDMTVEDMILLKGDNSPDGWSQGSGIIYTDAGMLWGKYYICWHADGRVYVSYVHSSDDQAVNSNILDSCEWLTVFQALKKENIVKPALTYKNGVWNVTGKAYDGMDVTMTLDGSGNVLSYAVRECQHEEWEESVITPATATETGLKSCRCKSCGKSYTEVIPAIYDVDENGTINADDLTVLLRHVAQIEPLSDRQLGRADMNGDGRADAADVALLAQSINNGSSTDDPHDGNIKIGVVYVGDEYESYTAAHMDGIHAAMENLGIASDAIIEYTSVPEDEDCYEKCIDLVNQGCNVIFTNSYGHQTYCEQAAREHPDVQFVALAGDYAAISDLNNFSNAGCSTHESRYVSGVVAGMKLRQLLDEGTITDPYVGYVAAFPYAEVISGYTAFFLGIKSVVPSAHMDVEYTCTWYDQTREAEAAEMLMDRGCVMIGQHSDSSGAPRAVEAALSEGKIAYSVGYNIDMRPCAPTAALTSAQNNWEVYFEYALGQVLAGEKIAADWCKGYAEGATMISALGGSCAPGTAEKVAEVEAGLKDGSLKVFDTTSFTVNGGTLISAPIDLSFGTWGVDGFTEIYHSDVGEAIVDGAFAESTFRSAPYFAIIIDGITELR